MKNSRFPLALTRAREFHYYAAHYSFLCCIFLEGINEGQTRLVVDSIISMHQHSEEKNKLRNYNFSMAWKSFSQSFFACCIYTQGSVKNMNENCMEKTLSSSCTCAVVCNTYNRLDGKTAQSLVPPSPYLVRSCCQCQVSSG